MQYRSQIPRPEMGRRLREGLKNSPVTALLGPRQCGKTWLTRHLATRPENYFDLQDFVDRVRLEESNFRVLDNLEGIVVLDEAQLIPELYPKLRVLADRIESRAHFLLTGSASPGIIRSVSESLAGRVRILALGGFTPEEIGWDNWPKLWLRGGFPRSYLHEIEENSFHWRLDYISTFLGRDLPALGEMRLSMEQLRRFLQLISHSHGQFWNHSEAGKVIGVSYKTIQRYVELLKGAFIIRELPPFHANIRKRLRKAHKIYLRDSGILHALLMLREQQQLWAHPGFGASWEGFCLEQIVQLAQVRDEECFTWSVQGGEEIDLVLNKPSGLFGFEFKAGDAPRKTRSMNSGVENLGLSKLFVVYPGTKNYALDEKIEVIGFPNLQGILARLK